MNSLNSILFCLVNVIPRLVLLTLNCFNGKENAMKVELGAQYQNQPYTPILQTICEETINAARGLGTYRSNWYRIEFIEHGLNDTLNIYYQGQIAFQAIENYGDWLVLYYNMPHELVEAMWKKYKSFNP